MSEDLLHQIMERVLHETSPKSVQMIVEVAQSRHKIKAVESSSELKYELKYTETSLGRRYFDYGFVGSGGLTFHQTAYCDGRKCANVSYAADDPNRQERILIDHDFMGESGIGFYQAPAPFRYDHVGLVPLHEALVKAERRGDEEVIGKRCDVFHFKGVRGSTKAQSLVYFLDKETAVPLRVAAYDNPDHVRQELPNWVWEAKTLDKISDHHFPLTSTYSSFAKIDSGGGVLESKLDMFQSIQVVKLEYGIAVPESAFWLSYQPGAVVMDTITKRNFTVPGGDTKVPLTTQSSVPIRADAGDYSLVLTGTGIALSIAVLATAFVCWRRAR